MAEGGTVSGANTFWLCVSLWSFILLYIGAGDVVTTVQTPSGWPWQHPSSLIWPLPWAYLLWSRCTEIGFAFLRDVYDKIGDPVSRSNLRPKDRLVLAFKSYVELICNFAMLFALCPADSWQRKPSAFPTSVGSPHDLSKTAR